MRKYLIFSILCYLRFWARLALALHKPTVIGVAGSVGKSSARNAITAILRDHFLTKAVGNSETGVPLGILGITPVGFTWLDWLLIVVRLPFGLNYLRGTKYLIAEMGIDDPNPPKNMEYLLTIVKPDIAISLNISPTHTEQFEKIFKGKEIENPMEQILSQMAWEDTKIIRESMCRIGIYNMDDRYIAEQINAFQKKTTKTELLSFGEGVENTISYKSYKISVEGINYSFIVNWLGKKEEINLHFLKQILPIVYQEVFAASILVGLTAGLNLQQITLSLEKNFLLPKGRGSIFQGINETLIIDSSYNASPSAVRAFLALLQELKKQTNRPFVFLFGDMRELGKEAGQEHEKIAQEIAKQADYLYCVGPLTRDYVIQDVEHQNKNFKEIRWFDSAKRAGEYLSEHLPQNALILVKGSQNTIFLEEAIKYILKDKADERKLCRQEKYWTEIKRKQGII